MRLSKRITNINGGGPDPWEFYYASKAAKAAGRDVVELTIGEPDESVDASILEEMRRSAAAGNTGYAPIPGTDELRDAIASRTLARTGVPTGRENVLVTAGGQAALFAAHMAVGDPGDRALLIDPYYATYPQTVRACGMVPVPVPAASGNGFLPTAEDVRRAASPGASSLLINTPNNPTGVVYPRGTVEEIADACVDADLWLISDEVYDTQVWEGEHFSPRRRADMERRIIVVGSMSKSHAMTGFRVGWVVADEEVIGRLADLAVTTTYGIAGFIQDAALSGLRLGPAFEERAAAPFRRRRGIVERLVAKQNVVRLIPPGGAMYVMLDIRATGRTGVEFAENLLARSSIAVMPGEGFGEAASGHVRVALTVDDSTLEPAIAALLDLAGETAAARERAPAGRSVA